jgi:hypothetical protein
MGNNVPLTSMSMDPAKIQEANDSISKYLQRTMNESRGEFFALKNKLTITYWIVILLSIVMFVLGLVLLSVPVIAAFNDKIDTVTALTAAGFGIADLTALFLYGPIEKIHNMMGDMSQIILALNSYRSQFGLRLMQMDIKDRNTVGETADKINEAAEHSIKLVQDYFETKEASN